MLVFFLGCCQRLHTPYNSIKRTERGAQKPSPRTDYGVLPRRFVLEAPVLRLFFMTQKKFRTPCGTPPDDDGLTGPQAQALARLSRTSCGKGRVTAAELSMVSRT